MTNFFSSLKTTERVNSEDFEDVEKVCEICSGFQDSRNSFFRSEKFVDGNWKFQGW